MPGNTLDVFISYSHADETLRQELEEQLLRLRREGLIGTWHERRITPEEAWRGWVDRDLRSADLILLIVSTPFLESAYCEDAEIRHALELQALGHAKVIPILARPCDWRAAPFAKLAKLPEGVVPVTEWHRRDSAWEDVAQGIREVANRLIAARLESTAEYRVAVRSPIRQAALAPALAKEVSAAGTPRWATIGALAMVLTTLVAVLLAVLWWPERTKQDTVRAPVAEMKPPTAEPGKDALAGHWPSPVAPTATERASVPQPGAAVVPESEPDAAETTLAPRQGPPMASAIDRLPGEGPSAEMDTTPEQPSAVAAGMEPATTEPAPVAAEGGAPSRSVAEPREAADFERALGILVASDAEGEGECIAVLVADEYALTNKACARFDVIVMGGNALTATRDEIFDLEPRQAPQETEIQLIKLLQGLGGTYGFVPALAEERFEYERLRAYYVEASAIRHAECVAVARVAESDRGGFAYAETTTLDQYARFVEAAADEAISIAGSRWAALLPEALDSAAERLSGMVCDIPRRPAGNLVFASEGRVVGIAYACEPFDRLEPEVRGSLPPEIHQPDLDCIASLGDIREQLRDTQAEIASP